MTESNFPLVQDRVEAGLLNSCDNMSKWLELSIFTDDDFTGQRAVFQFFKQHLSQYGSLPTASQLTTRFKWDPPAGEFQYWLDQMKKYSLSRKILTAILEGHEKVKRNTPEEALSSLLTNLSMIRGEQSNRVKATDAGALERLEKFDLRTKLVYEQHSMVGCRTGMKIIDDTKMGWLPAGLIGCFARPAVGKTWWLMWQGVNTWVDGGTVLAISPEMTVGQLGLRFDMLVADAMGHPLPYSKVQVGDPSVRADYELIINSIIHSSRWWTYDTTDEQFDVGDIAALINQHNPDIVLIDGISLLRSDSRGQTWEQMRQLAYGLKNLSTVKEVPILVNHQAVNSGRGRRGLADMDGRSTPSNDEFIMPSLNDAAYGDAFAGACSDVITMCGEPQSKHILWYALRKTRERGWQQPLEPRYALAVDFGQGKIIDLSEWGYAPAKVGEETQRLLGHL